MCFQLKREDFKKLGEIGWNQEFGKSSLKEMKVFSVRGTKTLWNSCSSARPLHLNSVLSNEF